MVPEVLTLIERATEDPHALLAVTDTLPPLVPAVALIEFVVELPVQPEGNVQVYVVAPGTAVVEYVLVLFVHTEALPVIEPGCAGIDEVVTTKTCAMELPQVLFATTLILPPVAPAVVVIELVLEVPVHPEGKVHV
jgi:hypothetical protein